ncbi:DUF134 domain-containing protein [Myxococcota bacterium]|nr:DUF134 domain-containing protein [Myxococcota bacterium]MBU1536456.1 DUF134 domain-containing protein [Myxococcota bacterium]
MPRKQNERYVKEPPRFSSFKPAGIPRTELPGTSITLDEFEAVKLADYLELDQQDAADQMAISRSTFSRLVARARQKIAGALINGHELIIEGGRIHFINNLLVCRSCGHQFTVTMETDMNKCPACGAGKLMDYAGSFGHGRCCRGHHKGNRGNHATTGSDRTPG